MAYTSITERAGKGSRLEHNVSTKKYREGWDRIFGKGARAKKPEWKPEMLNPDLPVRCVECNGNGELPQGSLTVVCRVCDGTGRLIYSS